MTIQSLRRYAIARSLFRPTTLKRALAHLGFVQADPIRAPARAQDLILWHRVHDYHAGDLEKRYSKLDVEEDFFINYGFVTHAVSALMHPRSGLAPLPRKRAAQAEALLDFVRERGAVHPREVDTYFAHGTVTNYWGGTSNATTHLLDNLHYRGLLRVVRREAGIRIYAIREPAIIPDDIGEAHMDALIDVVVRQYAPLPQITLSHLINRLRYCVPQWHGMRKAALARAKERLAYATVHGTKWYWPDTEQPRYARLQERVRLLAPFDPVVWDRRRFESFWGWAYRFEAYTPVHKRKLGYYAMPLLWRDQMIGWANVSVKQGIMSPEFGYIEGRPPSEAAFRSALEEELERMRVFLAVD